MRTYDIGDMRRALKEAIGRKETCQLAEIIFDMLETSIRLGERASALSYARYVAGKRFREDVSFSEIAEALGHFSALIETTLGGEQGLENLKERIHREIIVTTQLIIDEIVEVYDQPGRQEQ